MVNRPLVRRKAMLRLMGRLMPGMVLALIAEIIMLAVTFLMNACFNSFNVILPKTEDLISTDAIKAYFIGLMEDKYALLKLACIIAGAYLIGFIISAPLKFGTLRWYLNAAEDKTEPIGYALNSYSSLKEIGRSIWIYLYTYLHYLKWALVTFLPAVGIIVAASFITAGGNPSLGVSVFLLGILVGLGLSVLYIYITNRFFLAPYIYAEGSVSAAEACRESARMMRGQCGGLFVFRFSLVIVEFIATMFCYGAATIVAAPYINMCEASYAAELLFGSSEPKQEKVEYTVE